MSTRKPWDAHSERWKREARRDGLTKARWDRWIKLSPTTRKKTNPREYAKGVTVKDQIRKQLEDAVVQRMKRMFTLGRESTIRLGAQEMSTEELRWTLKASSERIQSRASVKVGSAERNRWWYR